MRFVSASRKTTKLSVLSESSSAASSAVIGFTLYLRALIIRTGGGAAFNCPSDLDTAIDVLGELCLRSIIFFFRLVACFSILLIARLNAMYMSPLVSLAVNVWSRQ